MSGRVLRVGPGVTRVKPGDTVLGCSLAGGAFAEQCLVPEALCFPVPVGVDPVTAAGMPVAYGTSHVALCHRAGLSKGQTCLVLGAAGGVGLAAVQICGAVGARCIAVARGLAKCQFLREQGAAVVLDSSAPGFDLKSQARGQGKLTSATIWHGFPVGSMPRGRRVNPNLALSLCTARPTCRCWRRAPVVWMSCTTLSVASCSRPPCGVCGGVPSCCPSGTPRGPYPRFP